MNKELEKAWNKHIREDLPAYFKALKAWFAKQKTLSAADEGGSNPPPPPVPPPHPE